MATLSRQTSRAVWGFYYYGERGEQPQIQDRPISKIYIGAVRRRRRGIYKITQLLPPEGDDFQYKIKSAAEPHERMVKESQLTPA